MVGPTGRKGSAPIKARWACRARLARLDKRVRANFGIHPDQVRIDTGLAAAGLAELRKAAMQVEPTIADLPAS